MPRLNQPLIALVFKLFSLMILAFTMVTISCTKDRSPEVKTLPIYAPMYSCAVTGGEVLNDGGTDILARGICWGEHENPTIGDNISKEGSGKGVFSSTIKGLWENTTYFFRAFATNEYGTSYGNQEVYTTANVFTPGGGLIDIDGNAYQSIILGDQEWMIENLKVIHYRNGDTISHFTNSIQWFNANNGVWCDYNNDPLLAATYGRLYNWYAVADNRIIAPEGWHVPTQEEWRKLVDYLGGASVAGGKLKEAGNMHWTGPNTGADNSAGFSGLPAGSRVTNLDFSNLGNHAIWWTSTDQPLYNLGCKLSIFSSSASAFDLTGGKNSGYSIRCVKD